MTSFDETFRTAYGFSEPSIEIGHVIREGSATGELPVRVPLRMMNRHGMIAGSTGTGKTRTLQMLAEGLSRAGVPVFLADVKGDLAGMCIPGEASERLATRAAGVGRTHTPEAFPVEFFSLTGNRGMQVRATVSSFGPVLLGKVLDLTEVQQSVLAMVFKYCDDRKMPLLDFDDLRSVLTYLTTDGKQDLKTYGGMSPATVGVLVRKMVELEQQGAAKFFGEPELDIKDLLRTVNGKGVVNILSLADVQDKPRLYSTFLMWLLGQFYYGMPEVGDPDKPKLVFFFDEAHQLFSDASSALVEHIEQVARLIRSKGIGVFFITQTPKDVDEDVLAQLGNRVQHAIRAYTPKDAKNVKATASTFPESEHIDVTKSLTTLGIGEALVTVLDPKGIPTAVANAQVLAPCSSMTAIDDAQYGRVMAASQLAPKYATTYNRESAHEMLQKKLEQTAAHVEQERDALGRRDEADDFEWRDSARRPAARRRTSSRPRQSAIEKTMNQVARTATREVTKSAVRGIAGILKNFW
ncbi:MAG TPA: helicase HerA-like domain-containing protein [Thermoanaerobaculia bacterium]|jgi:DNA helicase HerA-like ATPase|nr:helicase HerA-like domain-containing protein [Thermoanaerobaculia bacterium]